MDSKVTGSDSEKATSNGMGVSDSSSLGSLASFSI